MQCVNCKTKMIMKKKNIKYPLADLNLHMVEIPTPTCECCGYTEVAISGIKNIHMSVAGILINRIPEINGEQIKFLRKYMRMSPSVFYTYLFGGKPTEAELEATVLAWEKDKKKPDQINFIYTKHLVESYMLKEVEEYERLVENITIYSPEDF